MYWSIRFVRCCCCALPETVPNPFRSRSDDAPSIEGRLAAVRCQRASAEGETR